jgi:hypothetical protein
VASAPLACNPGYASRRGGIALLREVTYQFLFPDGRREALRIGSTPAAERSDAPAWTALEFHQCPNCPLSAERVKHCPMALNFVPLVELFARLRSYEEVTVQVQTPERVVGKRTTVQVALRSLMGLLAASSACPRVDFLKPMAHFHLPFSSEQETIYRVASGYLLAQYLLREKGEKADPKLDGLKARYQELQQVNQAMADRIRHIADDPQIKLADGTINALSLLDVFAQTVPLSIDATLKDLQPAFAQYLD